MYFSTIRRPSEVERDFKEANELKAQALDALGNGQPSMEYYKRAYEIYQNIAQNRAIEDEMRGKAAYNMYLLAKRKSVMLTPISSGGIILQTVDQRLQDFLAWASAYGDPDATRELRMNMQLSFDPRGDVGSRQEPQ